MRRVRFEDGRGGRCPGCGHGVLWRSGGADRVRAVCERCGSCWDVATPWTEVDSIACSGCERRPICESRPTHVVDAHSRLVELRDGSSVVIRPLLTSDRAELAAAYDHLSDRSRYRRFFSPPQRLSLALLDYLTNLDYDTHFALVAHVEHDPRHDGLGVARWVRDPHDASRADAAVTVVDDWQGRGLGTELLAALVAEATAHGVLTFTGDVLWENSTLLTPLRALGATIRPDEPGIAKIEFDLPASIDDLPGSAIARFFAAVASDEPPDAGLLALPSD